MANNYEKVTLESFPEVLKSGRYKGITGARRGIGKMNGWKEAERDQARAMANKFFKVDDSATVTAKPAAKKPGPAKKSAMKGKRTPVVAAADVEVTEGAFPAVKTAKRTPSVTVERVAPVDIKEVSFSPKDTVSMANEIIDIVGKAQQQIEYARKIDPNVDHASVHQSVMQMLKSVPGMFNVNQESAPAKNAKAPRDTVSETPAPVMTKLHVKTISAPVHAATETPAVSGDIKPSPVNAGPPLSPEEQEIADRIRNVKPVSGLAALPAPVAPQS